MLKVGVDFDGTLADWHHAETINNLVKTLIKGGAEIWIVTARTKMPIEKYDKLINNDLYLIAKELGIPDERIIMTDMEFKYQFMKEKGITILIDDNWEMIADVNWEGGCGLFIDYNPFDKDLQLDIKTKQEKYRKEFIDKLKQENENRI